jgi:hypothetical protein
MEQMKYDQLQPRLRQSPDKTIVTIGKYGCYLLSLMQIGKLILNDDTYEMVLKDLYYRYVGWKLMDGECSIIDGPEILRNLTGAIWKVEKIDSPIFQTISDEELERVGVIYRYRAFSGDGYHFKTADVDTEVERERLLAGFRIYTRRG